MSITQISADAVIVGDRFRHNLGDIGALARDIDAIGLLQPIVVTTDHRLIAGARRLAAWQQSRHKDEPMPAHVVDIPSLVRGEFSENMLRKDFSISERLAIMDVMQRELEAERAALPTSARPAPGRPGAGLKRVLDVVGDHLGISRRSLREAAAVAAAAQRNPGRYQHVFDEMERTGRIHPAFVRLRALDGLAPKKSRNARHGGDLFDALASLPLSTAKQRLQEYEQAATFLRILISGAGVPASEIDPISGLVSAERLLQAKTAALSGAA